MSARFRRKLLAASIALSFSGVAASPILAQNPDSILEAGIHDEIEIKMDGKYEYYVRKLLELDEASLRKYISENEGSLSIEVVKLLSLGLAGGSTSDELETLKRRYRNDQESFFNSSEHRTFKLKLVNQGVVNAWKEVSGNARDKRLDLKIDGDVNSPNGKLLMSFTNRPISSTDSGVTIRDLVVVGAEIIDDSSIKKGVEIPAHSGASVVLSRKGRSPVVAVLHTDGGGTVRYTLPEIKDEPVVEPTPEPVPPPTPIIAKLLAYIVIGDDDKASVGQFRLNILDGSGNAIYQTDTIGAGEAWSSGSHHPIEIAMEAGKQLPSDATFQVTLLDSRGKGNACHASVRVDALMNDGSRVALGATPEFHFDSFDRPLLRSNK